MDKVDHELFQRSLDKATAALGKSEVHRRLLRFLAERSLRGDAPKEIDIAIDVFGKDASFNSAEDAAVRVNVRTLRQKLDEYYRGSGAVDPVRFEIPKGGYRLIAIPHDAPVAPLSNNVESNAPTDTGDTVGVKSAPRRRWPWWAGGALLAALIVANTWLLSRARLPQQSDVSQEVGRSFAWSAVTSSTRPVTIVLGDLPLFSVRDLNTGRTRLIRDPLINTADQLRDYVEKYPAAGVDAAQIQTTLVPKSVVYGLTAILPLVNDGKRRVEVTLLDELKLDSIRDNDVIYIGPLVRLGPLRDVFLNWSRYRFDADEFRLTDTISHRTYSLSGTGEHLTDQGLFGSFPGPSRNHIVILASVSRDVGLLQVIRSMTSPEGLADVRKALGAGVSASQPFEVLMSVSGYHRTDLNANIIDAHPATRTPKR